jgi:hypothetical protein
MPMSKWCAGCQQYRALEEFSKGPKGKYRVLCTGCGLKVLAEVEDRIAKILKGDDDNDIKMRYLHE